MENKKSKILLFGNGLLQSFGGESWSEFLSSISKRDNLPSIDEINCPEPLKAILVTEDKVDVAMREKCSQMQKSIISYQLNVAIRELMSLGFDHILTTNYTYELEQAAEYPEYLTEYKLKKMTKSTVDRAEPKYLIHTYNDVTCDGFKNKIWHIHGEARKPDSTILGHYYYGNSLFKIKEEVKILEKSAVEERKEDKSWVEAFLFSDIYCLGFGFGFSEFDLWWLLNRKAREKKNKGKLYFYEPFNDKNWAKIELLKLMKNASGERIVDVLDLGYNQNNMNWQNFYSDAITDIKAKLNEKDSLGLKKEEKEILFV